ncbi:MAG: TonB-dependent receptor [Bacteroidales bacterium]|nr:TonB-dependent receptor [Bacteroidales bacterium]
MNKRLFITLLFLSLTFSSPLLAQGVLQGRVTNAEGKPVEYANVGVTNAKTPYGAVTDVRGFYRISVKSADTIALRVTCTGYQPQEFHLKLSSKENRTLNITLLPLSTQLNEVVVSDDHIRSTTFTQIDVQKIEHTVGPNQGVETLIKTLPDVSSNNELSSQYSVRGGSFDENLVYINGVEIYRPQLIRSGQQEGMSIINPDLVDHLLFSPGGFDATYGDRMSSVLDIIYSRPIERSHRLSLSLLGASASAQGRLGDRFNYSVGFRHHNNSYLFKSMDTEGSYSTSYTDLQGVFGYHLNPHLDLSLLAIWTRNRYGLIPSSRTTTFGGSATQSLEFNVYFDGREVDSYNTLLGALTLDYHPSDDFQLRWITSAQLNREQELYDIQDQYWLYEVGVGSNAADTNRFDRGVGTFLEHARNYLTMGIYATELKAVRYAALGNWDFGIKAQLEQIHDRMREWKWVDSAGYSFPTDHHTPGLDDTVVFNPQLQLFCRADNPLQTLRGIAYLQREINLFTRKDNLLRIQAGARAHYYTTSYQGGRLNAQMLLSPRLSVNYHPHSKRDILYRLAAGIYQQPYLYRETRRPDGTLRADLPAQTSYQATGTVDWNVHLWDKPFRLTADLYYKYITHLVPYTIDNLRIRYNPDQQAVGYATGVSLRIHGDFVPGLQSWASLSLMQTQEDILGDNLGWISRPTDQRLNFKIFLQDYLPRFPWWRMSLSFLYGTRTPVTFPYQTDRSTQFFLPPYFRVDWGNTIQLTRFPKISNSPVGRFFSDLSLGVEVFNLFNYRNVVSFIWVADYTNTYYAVPNYLTARQINVKLTATF